MPQQVNVQLDLHSSVIICSMSVTGNTSGKVKTLSRNIMYSLSRLTDCSCYLLTDSISRLSSFFVLICRLIK